VPEPCICTDGTRSKARNLSEQFRPEVFPYAVLPEPNKRAIRRYFEDQASAKVSLDAPFDYALTLTDVLPGAIGVDQRALLLTFHLSSVSRSRRNAGPQDSGIRC